MDCPRELVELVMANMTTRLGAIDIEICKQFNSFLQNIKYTGSHFTQSHKMMCTL